MSLPGVCTICRRPVRWGGRSWRDGNGRGIRHHCPSDRDVCGRWMPYAETRCARKPGHTTEHRSQWAMEYARSMRTGRLAA